ncbi:hypothetical protein SCUCBS95973_009401 [Sporothrix curviconia]|uniref:DUF6546 domain-containing protein n=1 Tax=Sporothrix curviconia TaxID=1260050 RepID=A0ABP0CX29_9PEZI
MSAWHDIPGEIRFSILELVVAGKPQPTYSEPGVGQYFWAPFAAVSREWRDFFERRTFASTALFNNDVQPFCKAVTRCPCRLTYIRRLRLTVDLPEYGCDQCQTGEDAATVKRNNVIFTRYLWPLLHALAAWTPPGPGEPQPLMRNDAMFRAEKLNSAIGIQFELGVRSPSDAQHAFLDYRIRHPHRHVYGFCDLPKYLEDERNSAQHNSAAHGWSHGIRITLPSYGAVTRVLGAQPLEFDADGLGGDIGPDADADADAGTDALLETERGERYRLRHAPPAAAIVRKLVLGRRFYRALHPATVSHLLTACFPHVQYVHLEPWRPVDTANANVMERGFRGLLASLPPSLLNLTIYVEHNINTIHSHVPTLTRRTPDPYLGRLLAENSSQLEVVNVAHLVEADDFFATAARRLHATTTWSRLHTLVLTSSTLAPASTDAAIEGLLVEAAVVAACMPQLRRLELWYANSADVFVFTYDVSSSRQATICIRTQWNWPLRRPLLANVERAWRDMHNTKTWAASELRLVHWPFRQSAVQMDARRLVLWTDTLTRKLMFKQSLEDMQLEGLFYMFM